MHVDGGVHVRRRYAAWLDLVDDLGLVEIGLGVQTGLGANPNPNPNPNPDPNPNQVETGLGGRYKGQYKGQFTRREALLCFELNHHLPCTTYHVTTLSRYHLPCTTYRPPSYLLPRTAYHLPPTHLSPTIYPPTDLPPPAHRASLAS